jgi:hypothetical protein
LKEEDTKTVEEEQTITKKKKTRMKGKSKKSNKHINKSVTVARSYYPEVKAQQSVLFVI